MILASYSTDITLSDCVAGFLESLRMSRSRIFLYYLSWFCFFYLEKLCISVFCCKAKREKK